MKMFLLLLLFVIALGGVLGMLVARDPGYVLISYGEYALETGLWVALFLLVLTYLVLRGLGVLTRSILTTQAGLLRWQSGRKLRQARAQTVRGMLMLAEGRWQEAEKLLVEAAGRMETPLVNYLNAARAAHERGEFEQRDRYLTLAQETTPGAKFAVSLTQAELNIDQGQYEQALAALLVLHKRAPKHAAVLNMLATCYALLPDAPALLALLPTLRKLRTQSETALDELAQTAWHIELPNAKDVRATWKRLPESVKASSEAMAQWINGLITQGQSSAAEQAIRLVLAEYWHAPVLSLYGQILGSDLADTTPERRLQVAQKWLKDHPEDPVLLLTLGRLSLSNEQFEQAREYFESSLRMQPSPETYGELGRLLVALGDEKRGMQYLLSAQTQLPELPQPANQMISRVGVS